MWYPCGGVVVVLPAWPPVCWQERTSLESVSPTTENQQLHMKNTYQTTSSCNSCYVHYNPWYYQDTSLIRILSSVSRVSMLETFHMKSVLTNAQYDQVHLHVYMLHILLSTSKLNTPYPPHTGTCMILHRVHAFQMHTRYIFMYIHVSPTHHCPLCI